MGPKRNKGRALMLQHLLQKNLKQVLQHQGSKKLAAVQNRKWSLGTDQASTGQMLSSVQSRRVFAP
jgi:hypothetical protein